MMTEQAREARRAYKRQWARDNRDKVRAAQDRYWERRAQQAEDETLQAETVQEIAPEPVGAAG